MANTTQICIGNDCSEVQNLDISNLFRVVSGTYQYMTIPAGSALTQAVPLNIPSGYVFAAFRQIAINNGSEGSNSISCVLRFFGTASGGTVANVSVYNAGTQQAKVRLEVVALAVKEN